MAGPSASGAAGGGSQDGASNPVFQDPDKPLQLSSFREKLIRQEETIIFALIERAQFLRNDPVYVAQPDAGGKLDGLSLLDFLFRETEKIHAKVNRYACPDEHAFFPHDLPMPALAMGEYPAVLRANDININPKIKEIYLTKVLPQITEEGIDKRMFGSAAVADIACLQALSQRIHFGKFIAEAKFQAEVEEYSALIRARDTDSIMKHLTVPHVEEAVLKRVELKASTYGQDIGPAPQPAKCKVAPSMIRALYQDIVMPLTKDVEVEYLLQRLEHHIVVCVGPEGGAAHQAALQHFGDRDEVRRQIRLLPEGRPDEIVVALLSNTAEYGVAEDDGRQELRGDIKRQITDSHTIQVVGEVSVKQDAEAHARFVVLGKQKRRKVES